MVAEFRPLLLDEQGQSILEFVLMLPLLVGLAVMALRVNTPIQMSIVNQQYARAQIFFLSGNSPVFPRLGLRQVHFDKKGYNQLMIGVSENVPQDGEGSDYRPIASTFKITRKPGGSNDPGDVHTQRSEVRVRNTVHLCSQTNVIFKSGKVTPILELDSNLQPAGPNLLIGSQKVSFPYCRSPLDE